MNIITEQYVEFETAKLLKEKGFDALCTTFYYVDTPTKVIHQFQNDENEVQYVDINEYPCAILAPTQQMAMRWLREVHNYNIEVDTIGFLRDKSLCYRSAIYYLIDENECFFQDNFNSYEEACEAAIKYCLENLI